MIQVFEIFKVLPSPPWMIVKISILINSIMQHNIWDQSGCMWFLFNLTLLPTFNINKLIITCRYQCRLPAFYCQCCCRTIISLLCLPQEFECNAEDLKELKELGHGAYGYVYKMIHQPTGHIMAVKVNLKQTGGCRFSHHKIRVSKFNCFHFT